MFIPKRIYVKPQSRNSIKAREIIERTRKLNPTVEIIELRTKEFIYPANLSSRDKFLHMKESVILSERTEPFVRTFASPGNIVEALNTTLNYTWMCPLNCEYCYLQTNQTPEHYFYTNLEDLEREFVTAPHAHYSILTIWSMLSFAKKQALLKIPEGLMEYGDELREDFAQKRITTNRRAIDWIYVNQKKIYKALKGNQSTSAFGLSEKKFMISRDNVQRLFEQNTSHRLRMIPSEFCDMVAVDHLTKNISHLAKLVANTPDITIDIRTKAHQLDDIRTISGSGRIKFGISLNTEYVIKTYEHGTASLDERFNAARTVQDSEGYGLDLIIEPFVKYDKCLEDYSRLIDRIAQTIDLSRVNKISLGSVRYRKQLRAAILRNYPTTNLFNSDQDLQEPESDDHRLRYSIEYLAGVYDVLQKKIRQHSDVRVSLGAEKPALWMKLGMDSNAQLAKSVYQYSGIPMKENKKEENTSQESGSTPNITTADDLADDQQDPSVFYQCALMRILTDKGFVDERNFRQSDSTLEEIDGLNLWDSVDPVTIKTARQAGNLWVPVKIIGKLVAVTDARPVDIGTDESRATLSTRILTFQDKDREKVEVLAYPEDWLPDNINELLRSQRQLTFHGAMIIVETQKDIAYRFFLRRLEATTLMRDFVAAKNASKIDPQFTINVQSKQIGIPENHPYLTVKRFGYKKQDASRNIKAQSGIELFEHIKKTLMNNLRIIGSEAGARHIERGVEFTILQALSEGNRQGFSNKLHGLIIGPPNVGKSKLIDAAKVTNPVFDELSVTSAKHTAAGMIGKVRDAKGTSISTGGIYPRATGGVVLTQDFHLMDGKARQMYFEIGSLLMEKGVVRDDTSANATMEANVSLLIDTNRRHQVKGFENITPYSYNDLEIPINILSRFDFILEIPKDKERQEQVMDKLDSTDIIGGVWQTELKDLVAFLRDEYRWITVPDELNAYADEQLRRLFNKYKSVHFEEIIDDHRIRIKRSVWKFVQAIARAWARPVVTREHIDFAIPFIEEKISFLALQAKEGNHSDGRTKLKDERMNRIVNHFGNKPFTRVNLESFLKKEYGESEKFNLTREINSLRKAKLIRQLERGKYVAVNNVNEVVNVIGKNDEKKGKISTKKGRHSTNRNKRKVKVSGRAKKVKK